MKNFDTPLDEMLYILSKESEQPVPDNLIDSDKRWLINSLMTIRSPGYLDERFLSLQNDLLTRENANFYDCNGVKFRKHFALTRRDITDLKINAVCCETMDYLGSMIPNLRCMDNKILLKGGLEIREECNKINQANNFICRVGSAFDLAGYNLPADRVIKIILPRVDNMIQYDVDKIKSGILSALDFMRDKGIKKFAINLSIDSGFNIPNEMYINVIVHTISKYIKDKKYKVDCVLVVDNDRDEMTVKDLLKIKSVF